jgi:hypothetical protein
MSVRRLKLSLCVTLSGLGRARPGPSQGSRLWPGLGFEKAEAASGQAKAGALRPSRAGTALFYRHLRYLSVWLGALLSLGFCPPPTSPSV